MLPARDRPADARRRFQRLVVDAPMRFLLYAAVEATLRALFWVVLINALLSWVPGLTQAGGPLAALERMTARVVDPLLDPIRRRMPGGIVVDFSPLILLLLLQIAAAVVARLAP